MKTKTFIILFLSLGMGLTQLFAQDPPPNGQNGNGSRSYWGTTGFIQELFSEDGTVIDPLFFTVTYHCVVSYKDGVPVHYHYNVIGSATSEITGETFTMKDIDKATVYSLDPYTGFDSFHLNIIGDHGTHMLAEATLDYATWQYTITKIFWPGDKYWPGN
jgi:hypothetical protein